MSFDYEKHTKLLSDFIANGKSIKHFKYDEIQRILEPLCRNLRVGRISSAIYELRGNLDSNSDKEHNYFDDGTADEARAITFEEYTVQNRILRCYVYPKKGEPDWNENEIDRIKELVDLLYLFSERAYTLKLLEDIPIHDNDIGVYTISLFTATLKTVIEQGNIGAFGIVHFNISRLSAINEYLGREQANNAMKSFITGLVELINYEECVCRLGSDNFLMLFKKERTEEIKKYLSGTPVFFGGGNETVTISTCAGFFLIPENSDNPSEIIDSACTAYQLAKTVYKRPYLFFNDDIMKRQKQAKMIETIFPSAIANEEFKVFYQPKTHLNNYMIAGAEALCRWFRDDKIIPPGEFIPVLESSKAICTLDFYVLEHVCQDIRRWLDEKREVVKISVNLSRIHLGDEDLLETIIGIVDKYRVPHNLIEIELTETTTDVDFRELKKIVKGMHEQNISTSVDDFGIGYSSLNLIRELPWNVLKIDKSFLPTNKEKKDASKLKMLKHIISMTLDLGLECIVEGVETPEQVKLLRECKCYLAQGYYFDKPLPVEEFEHRLDEIKVC